MLPNWTENTIDVNGVAIHYTRTGRGDKPPLVLAHGYSDSGLCWPQVANELSGSYDVILPDARGHGRSARVHAGEHVDMVADLAGLVHALGLQSPILGGHSMGASVTAQVAARFPGLARALILEDPGWHIELPHPRPAQEQKPEPNPWEQFLFNAKNYPIEKVIAWCRKNSPTWAEIELLPWAESKQQFDTAFTTIAREQPLPWQEVVARITCPTLLLTADNEKGAIITPDMAKQAVETNPLVQVVNIPGAGHNIRRENFPTYMQAVWQFLKKL